jgi:hypothetical protein
MTATDNKIKSSAGGFLCEILDFTMIFLFPGLLDTKPHNSVYPRGYVIMRLWEILEQFYCIF